MRFPEDPNMPRPVQNDPEDQEENKKKERNEIWGPIEKFIVVISVFIAAWAGKLALDSLQVSRDAYNTAIAQFNENNISSETQFRTISKLMKSYQDINANVLSITASQLQQTKEMLHQINELGKPIVTINKINHIPDVHQQRNAFKNFINLSIGNAGRRPLQLQHATIFIISHDKVQHTQSIKHLNALIDNNDFQLSFRTKYIFSHPSYIYFLFDYYDLVTKENLNKEFYVSTRYTTKEEEENDLDRGSMNYNSNNYDPKFALSLNTSANDIQTIKMAMNTYKTTNKKN